MNRFEKLGRAFLAVERRDEGEHDSRGWNKALDAVVKEYERLTEREG